MQWKHVDNARIFEAIEKNDKYIILCSVWKVRCVKIQQPFGRQQRGKLFATWLCHVGLAIRKGRFRNNQLPWIISNWDKLICPIDYLAIDSCRHKEMTMAIKV